MKMIQFARILKKNSWHAAIFLSKRRQSFLSDYYAPKHTTANFCDKCVKTCKR